MAKDKAYVHYNRSTGTILNISPIIEENWDQDYAEVDLEDVKPIILGLESPKKWIAEHSLVSDQVEVRRKTDYILKKLTVKDMLYEIPTSSTGSADIIVIQDFTRKFWKILIGDHLENQLLNKKVSLKHELAFSVTEKGNPNILYKSLLVDLEQLIKNHYQVIPFSDSFEQEKLTVSVYTKKEFSAYYYKRIDE